MGVSKGILNPLQKIIRLTGSTRLTHSQIHHLCNDDFFLFLTIMLSQIHMEKCTYYISKLIFLC
jgi:hypothetical protein